MIMLILSLIWRTSMKVDLPTVKPPIANFVSYRFSDKLIYISGQLPLDNNGTLKFKGRVGEDFSTEEGQEAAKLCALYVLANLKQAIQSLGKESSDNFLEKVKSCIELSVFINSTPDFTEHSKVANGASDLVVELLGKEKGTHSRAAVGVPSLPLGAAVEVKAIFEIE